MIQEGTVTMSTTIDLRPLPQILHSFENFKSFNINSTFLSLIIPWNKRAVDVF